jgi:hypothetical protein
VGEAAPGGLGRLARLRGVTALGVGRPFCAVALQENGMALEAGCAAFVRLGFALLGPVVLDNHAETSLPPLFSGTARGERATKD